MFKKILFICFLVTILVSYWLFHDAITIAQISELVSAFAKYRGGPLIFILIYIAAVIFFAPGSILTISGGFLFGPIYGTTYNIIGAVIGATCAFIIARYFAANWVAARVGGKLKTIKEGLEAEGWRFIAVVRLVPILPFNLLNYALGLTRVNIFTYIITSGIFMLPGCFAYTYLGSLGEIFLQSESHKIANYILQGVGVVVILFCIPYLVKLLRK